MKRIACIIIFLMAACIGVSAQVTQWAEVSGIAAIPNINNHGATSIELKYAMTFAYSREEKLKMKDSSESRYYTEVRFETDSGPVAAAEGYEQYADSGAAATFTDYTYVYSGHYYPGQTLFVPVAALALDTGYHRLRVVFRVYDEAHALICTDAPVVSFRLRMPPIQRYKVMIRDISVTSLDPKGESWDYYWFNSNKSKPDVFWEIFYGGHAVHVSDTQWDTYEYEDKYGSSDYTFCVAKGDLYNITVMDRDVLSRNDFIGSTAIDTKQPLCCSGKLQRKKFNSVLGMVYAISTDPNASLQYRAEDDTILNPRKKVLNDAVGYPKK